MAGFYTIPMRRLGRPIHMEAARNAGKWKKPHVTACREKPLVVVAYDESLAGYRFGSEHPLRPERFTLTMELARQWGLLDRCRVDRPEPATTSDLLLVHRPDMVDAVHEASYDPVSFRPRAGIGPGDTPAFLGMHEAGASVVGATMHAVTEVLAGRAERGFCPAGGMHHAHRDHAAGFCIYNDCAVAIEKATREHEGLRVAYVDIDAHHGDGVQEAFFDRPDVLTISVHESGRYLYPGTGHQMELGTGEGYGFTLNVPLPPFSEQTVYDLAFDEVVVPALRAYRPDLIVAQLGADGHVDDPLTHLALTVQAHHRLVKRLVEVADEVCNGRIVGTGGGGYGTFSAVPRMWACALAAFVGVDPPAKLPAEWLAQAEKAAGDADVPFVKPGATFDEHHEPPSGEALQDMLRQTQLVIDRLKTVSPLLAGE